MPRTCGRKENYFCPACAVSFCQKCLLLTWSSYLMGIVLFIFTFNLNIEIWRIKVPRGHFLFFYQAQMVVHTDNDILRVGIISPFTEVNIISLICMPKTWRATQTFFCKIPTFLSCTQKVATFMGYAVSVATQVVKTLPFVIYLKMVNLGIMVCLLWYLYKKLFWERYKKPYFISVLFRIPINLFSTLWLLTLHSLSQRSSRCC